MPNRVLRTNPGMFLLRQRRKMEMHTIGDKAFTERPFTANLIYLCESDLVSKIADRLASESWGKSGITEKSAEDILAELQDSDWDYLSSADWAKLCSNLLKPVKKGKEFEFDFDDWLEMPDELSGLLKKKLKENLKSSSLFDKVLKLYQPSIRALKIIIESNQGSPKQELEI